MKCCDSVENTQIVSADASRKRKCSDVEAAALDANAKRSPEVRASFTGPFQNQRRSVALTPESRNAEPQGDNTRRDACTILVHPKDEAAKKCLFPLSCCVLPWNQILSSLPM